MKPTSSTYTINTHIFLHTAPPNSHLYSNYIATSLYLVQSSVFLTLITLPMLCFQSCFLPALNIVLVNISIKYCFSAISLKPWRKILDSSFFTLPPTFCLHVSLLLCRNTKKTLENTIKTKKPATLNSSSVFKIQF